VGSALFDLYLVTDRHQTRGRDLLWIVQQALEGGVKAIQLREKDLGGRELFNLAEKTRKLCLDYQALLLINDRIDIAIAVDADGVQLGNASVPVSTARELLGPNKLIGASTHSLAEAMEAEQSGADFVLFGPVFFTPSKAAYGPPQGLTALREIIDNVSVPVYGIGGINLGNVDAVKRAGANGAALISAIIGTIDPQVATRQMLERLQK
jgi:thiamine-phosphate pyrophosphorylase